MRINEFGVKLYTAYDVAKRMNVPVKDFLHLVELGYGPHKYEYKGETQIRYTEKEIDSWMVKWRLNRIQWSRL